MQITRFERPRRSPTQCFICGRSDTPVWDIHLQAVTVATATGKLVVPANVYICTGHVDSCLWQMARGEGWVPGEDVDREREKLLKRDERIRELEATIEENAVMQVVPLADLEALLAKA